MASHPGAPEGASSIWHYRRPRTPGDGVDTHALTRTLYIDTRYRIHLPLVLRNYR